MSHVYEVFYVWNLDGGERETFMSRLGRLWQSGVLSAYDNTIKRVLVCEGVMLERFNENMWLTVESPCEPLYIRMEVGKEDMFDYYLDAAVPYGKDKVMGELADFIEDYFT